MTNPKSRFLRAAWAIAGALPWLVLFLLFQLWRFLYGQVGFMRALGTFELFVLAILVLALATAALALLLRADHPRLQRLWRTAFFALAAANGAAVGLAVFHHAPALAPTPYKALALLVVGGLVVAFARYREPEQAFVTRSLLGLGWGVMALTLLGFPWVATAAGQDHPRLPAAVAPPEAEWSRPTAPKRVVLVTFDGLRARSAAPFNPSARTPHLAALAARSTWFSQCRAASDATLSSMTTILTGTPPAAIFPRLDNRTGFLRQGMLTGLGGHLAPAGYRSYFATMLVNPQFFGLQDEFSRGRQVESIFPVSNDFNSQEFLPWRRSLAWLAEKTVGRHEATPPLPGGPRAVETTVDLGLRFLTETPERTFLWLHLAAPHAPLYEVDFTGPRPRLKASPTVSFNEVGEATPERARRYEALYEDYVRYADSEFGRFMAALEASHLASDTLFVVTADHGDEFVAGRFSHGAGHLSEDVTHVPLLIHHPGQTAGQRVDRLVSHVDILPSVLAAVYRQVPAGLAGVSLASPPPSSRTIYTWGLGRRYFASVATAEMAAAYRWPFKYLVSYLDDREFLFDLARDPRAAENIMAAHPEVASELRAGVQRMVAP